MHEVRAAKGLDIALSSSSAVYLFVCCCCFFFAWGFLYCAFLIETIVINLDFKLFFPWFKFVIYKKDPSNYTNWLWNKFFLERLALQSIYCFKVIRVFDIWFNKTPLAIFTYSSSVLLYLVLALWVNWNKKWLYFKATASELCL